MTQEKKGKKDFWVVRWPVEEGKMPIVSIFHDAVNLLSLLGRNPDKDFTIEGPDRDNDGFEKTVRW